MSITDKPSITPEHIPSRSVFAAARHNVWQHAYRGRIHVTALVGGIPTDPRVAEGWITSKLADKDDLVRDLVAQTMIERGVTVDEATDIVTTNRHLNGFKRTDGGQLFIEGRQLKACIKEASNIRWPKDRWGPSKKGTRSFFAEHVMVLEDRLTLRRATDEPVTDADGINQRFVHTWRGAGISYEEYVTDAEFGFTVVTDHAFTRSQWEELWVTAEMQGIGATRSQGFGRFAVVAWDQIDPKDAGDVVA